MVSTVRVLATAGARRGQQVSPENPTLSRRILRRLPSRRRNPAFLQIVRTGSPALVSNRLLSAITANDRRPPLPAIRDFATWAPLLAILWGSQQGVDYAGGYVDGPVGYRGGVGSPTSPPPPPLSPPRVTPLPPPPPTPPPP